MASRSIFFALFRSHAKAQQALLKCATDGGRPTLRGSKITAGGREI
jgi:hypothetical protein